MNRCSSAIVLVCALVLSGCSTIETSRVITGATRAPSSRVEVLMEGEPPPDGFLEIALVQARATGEYANLAGVVQGLKEESQSLGCTHVIRVRIDQGANMASGTGVCGILPLRPAPR